MAGAATLTAALGGCTGRLTELGERIGEAGESTEGDDTGGDVDRGTGADLEQIAYGETKEGSIDDGDGREPQEGDLGEPVTFEGETGDRILVDMRSDPLDTYLVLEGPDGDVVATDDDGGSGYDSSLQTVLPATGTYTIWATTYDGDDTGPYTLSLERTGTAAAPGFDLRSIGYGETKEGYVETDDGREPQEGDVGEPVVFEGETGDGILVDLRSDPLDTYLVLEGPDGDVVATDDDGGTGLDSRIETTLTATGRYTIWVTTYDGDDTGPYTLSLERVASGDV